MVAVVVQDGAGLVGDDQSGIDGLAKRGEDGFYSCKLLIRPPLGQQALSALDLDADDVARVRPALVAAFPAETFLVGLFGIALGRLWAPARVTTDAEDDSLVPTHEEYLAWLSLFSLFFLLFSYCVGQLVMREISM